MAPKIYRSSYPDVELSDLDLVSYLFSNPRNVSFDTPIYIDAITSETRTGNDIVTRTKSLAAGLRNLGLQRSDVVALFSPNTVDYAIQCWAVIGCAATISPVNAASTPSELSAQLKTAGAKYLIVHSTLLSTAKEAAKSIAGLTLIQADGPKSSLPTPTALHLATHTPSTSLSPIPASEVKTRLAFLCFSSGTTGAAKGVMTTHHNIVSNMLQWDLQLASEWSHAQSLIGFLPFSHIYGLHSFLCNPLVNGSTVHVMPRFDLPLFLSLIQKTRPEQLVVVPPVVLALVKHPLVTKYDLSSVQRILSAAAPLSNELREAAEKRFKDLYGTEVLCLQAWGMTETSPLGATVTMEFKHKRHTVGSLAPNMEMRIVDPETMRDCEFDGDGETATTTPGELWVRGPNVTSGYYRNEKATAESTYADAEADGGRKWFRTGDIGTVDRDGFVTIVDRIKEMIKYKGFQVIPSELEGKLLEHPDVEDACVVGVWVDGMATEVPAAFVTVKGEVLKDSGREKVAKLVKEWLEAKVAGHKRCRGGVYVVDEVPKSPSGKILRRQLKKEWEETVRQNVEAGQSKL